jgi:hypothetical protein
LVVVAGVESLEILGTEVFIGIDKAAFLAPNDRKVSLHIKPLRSVRATQNARLDCHTGVILDPLGGLDRDKKIFLIPQALSHLSLRVSSRNPGQDLFGGWERQRTTLVLKKYYTDLHARLSMLASGPPAATWKCPTVEGLDLFHMEFG